MNVRELIGELEDHELDMPVIGRLRGVAASYDVSRVERGEVKVTCPCPHCRTSHVEKDALVLVLE